MKPFMVACMILVACGAATWLWYENDKRIILVAAISYDEWLRGYKDISVMDIGVLYSSECFPNKRFPSNGYFFAVRGRICLKFSPWEFHSVYADVISEPADPNMVYVHSCNRRYAGATVDAP